MVWYSYLLKNFTQFIVTQRLQCSQWSRSRFFLELSCFFHDPMDVGNLISGFSAFSKLSLNIWNFSVHVLWNPHLENIEHYFASVWDECSCVIIWAFLGIAFLWDWNESWYFPVLWPFWLFQIHNAKECSNYHTIALISHASKVMLKILQAGL